MERRSVILVRGPGGRLFNFIHPFLRGGVSPWEQSTQNTCSSGESAAFAGSLGLDLATGFEKTAMLAADKPSGLRRRHIPFLVPEKARAILLFRFLFSTFRFDNSLFGR